MSASISPQVRMANDIAAQFRHLPADDAAAAVAAHLGRFWDARMLTDLLCRVGAGEGDLDPLVIAAAHLLDAAA